MYRCWNNKEKHWANSNVFISPNMDIFETKQFKLKNNIIKINLVSDKDFTIQFYIGTDDKNGKMIFEGDIVKTNFNATCIVCYIPEFLSYVLLDFNSQKYYTLSKLRCNNELEIIGNVCENPDIIPEYYEQNNKTILDEDELQDKETT